MPKHRTVVDCIIYEETETLKWGDVFTINPDSPGIHTPWDKASARDFKFRAVPPKGNQ